MMKEALVKLADGRALAYCIYGDENAVPVLYFHGTPSSRLEPLLLKQFDKDPEALLKAAGLRLIAFDRPGMGLSTRDKNSDFLSVARDAKMLAGQCGIKTCHLLCWSGGGPYALALAHLAPDLVKSVSIICGFTKRFDKAMLRQMGMNRWYFILAKKFPLLLRSGMNLIRKKRVTSVPPQSITGLPYADYSLIKKLPVFQMLAQVSLKEAARQGAAGPVQEARSYFKDFGFDIASVKCRVHYWWGVEDMSVIRLHAEETERKIPQSVMHYRENEGHLSLYVNHFEEVLQVISRMDGEKEF